MVLTSQGKLLFYFVISISLPLHFFIISQLLHIILFYVDNRYPKRVVLKMLGLPCRPTMKCLIGLSIIIRTKEQCGEKHCMRKRKQETLAIKSKALGTEGCY